MDARELRIENYIQLYLKPDDSEMTKHKIISIFYNNIENEYFVELEDGFKVNINKGIVPIPLTEEILLKCGFDKYTKSEGIFFKNSDFFELHQFNENGDFSYKCGDNLEGNFVYIRIDYLHQLQNLHFALTGVELEIIL